MPDQRSPGRMIRTDISRSKKIATLSPEACAVFFFILPHLNAWGKSNGNPLYIKGEVMPLVDWATIPVIEACLREISGNTNVKWFQGEDGTWYLHALKWDEHQGIRKDKRGADRLPSYPATNQKQGYGGTTTELRRNHDGPPPEVVPREEEVEVEVKEEVKEEDKEEVEVEVEGGGARAGLGGPPAPPSHPKGNGGNGKSTPSIKRRMSWRDFIPELQRGVDAGEIPVASAKQTLLALDAPKAEVDELFGKEATP